MQTCSCTVQGDEDLKIIPPSRSRWTGTLIPAPDSTLGTGWLSSLGSGSRTLWVGWSEAAGPGAASPQGVHPPQDRGHPSPQDGGLGSDVREAEVPGGADFLLLEARVGGWPLGLRLSGATWGSPGAADPLPAGTGVAQWPSWRCRRASSRKWCPSTNTET